MEQLALCICGNDISGDQRIDSVYPCNRERTKWNVCCKVHNGGCGRTVYAETVKGAIRNWNNGLAHEYFDNGKEANNESKG